MGLTKSRFRSAVTWLAVWISVGTLLFLYKWLDRVASGDRSSWLVPFITEYDAAFCGAILFLPLYAIMKRNPFSSSRLPLYLALMFGFAFLGTTMMWGTRALLFPLAGLGRYDYGAMPVRYFMELPAQIVVFCIIAGATQVMWKLSEARERELALARAQLQNLRSQLQPHFLFNVLNTISSTMYDNPAAADEMLERLSELLRLSLRTADTDQVPLSTELETLDCYLAIMKARFGEKLDVRIDVDPAVCEARVPSMLLQPLVENAIRHGKGAVKVAAVPSGGDLVLEVLNGLGDASGPPVDSNGLGLAATGERIRLLYGSGRFDAGNRGDLFAVRMRIPR